ncbi:MAG TPA: DUF493 domain-containing protein [Bellilinea sp.]|nr:DUF493 domain-containing protein [Bellilinea sp.]
MDNENCNEPKKQIEFIDTSKPVDKAALAFPVSMKLRIIAREDPTLREEIFTRLSALIPELKANEIREIASEKGNYNVYHVPMTVENREQFDAVYAAFKGDPRIVWVI